MNTTVMTVNYDDFWGKGPRRTQIFLFSISAPKCNVLNFKPAWVKGCIANHGGNETACYRQILDEFDELGRDRVIQAGVEKDFGEVGAAFLKCKGRPARSFQYETDLMVHQSYWAGGAFHVEIQTSSCRAEPLLRNSDWQYGLFKVSPVDQEADVKIALPPRGWFGYLVTLAYGVISVCMIAQGILALFTRVFAVGYAPQSQRFTKTNTKCLQYATPFMPIASFFSENENASITFKGSLFVGSDIWMNHWLFIWISVLDAIVNLRMSYLTLGVGTWMINLKQNTENFLFLCSGLTKLTWLMCLAHTAFRLLFKFVVRSLRNMNAIKSSTRDKLEWYVDAASLFLSYKLYNLLMCLIIYLLLTVNGTTTMMKKAVPAKIGMCGGRPRITNFWGNEIICDLVVLFSLLALCGLVIGVGMLCTKYRRVPNNSVIRLLQSRYILVGWDAILACQVLGIDPFDPEDEPNLMLTKCSLGSLLQLLYASRPSGFVHLAGDYPFTDEGFAGTPKQFRYSVARAIAIGLVKSNRDQTNVGTSNQTDAGTQSRYATGKSPAVAPTEKHNIFQRRLAVVSDDNRRLLFVDEKAPGAYEKNPETGIREYVVQDALSYMSILDMKPLLGNEKKLRFQ